MSINGISTNYKLADYVNIKPDINAAGGSFKDTISEKAASKKINYDERAFEYLGPNAPEEVFSF